MARASRTSRTTPSRRPAIGSSTMSSICSRMSLCRRYADRKMAMLDIFLDHRQYAASSYKDALNELEDKGLISVDPPANKRRMGPNGKRTFKDEAIVTFPPRNQ